MKVEEVSQAILSIYLSISLSLSFPLVRCQGSVTHRSCPPPWCLFLDVSSCTRKQRTLPTLLLPLPLSPLAYHSVTNTCPRIVCLGHQSTQEQEQALGVFLAFFFLRQDPAILSLSPHALKSSCVFPKQNSERRFRWNPLPLLFFLLLLLLLSSFFFLGTTVVKQF